MRSAALFVIPLAQCLFAGEVVDFLGWPASMHEGIDERAHGWVDMLIHGMTPALP